VNSTVRHCRVPCGLMAYSQLLMHCSRPLGKSLLPPLHHHVLPTHAAWRPYFNRVLVRPLKCSGKGELTLRSKNPFSRSAEVRATPSGTPRIGSPQARHDHKINRQRAPVCSKLTTFRKTPHGVAALEWRTIMEARGRRLCLRPNKLEAKSLNGGIHQTICD
jgi:hypothetical protein